MANLKEQHICIKFSFKLRKFYTITIVPEYGWSTETCWVINKILYEVCTVLVLLSHSVLQILLEC